MAQILVVDDNPCIFQLLQEIFKNEGHLVITASTATEAIEQLQQKKPSLILVDLILGQESGLSLIKKLRLEPFPIKVIAISALGELETNVELQRALQHGADRVLSKPFSLRELVQTVNGLLMLSQTPHADANLPHSHEP